MNRNDHRNPFQEMHNGLVIIFGLKFRIFSHKFDGREVLPLSSKILMTKYLELSVTDSIATPGYVSTGQFANNTPVILSSNFRLTLFPFATKRIRPVHVGSAKFQFPALELFLEFAKINFRFITLILTTGCSPPHNLYCLRHQATQKILCWNI